MDTELMQEALGLEQKWNELVREAKRKDKELTQTKKEFANVT